MKETLNFDGMNGMKQKIEMKTGWLSVFLAAPALLNMLAILGCILDGSLVAPIWDKAATILYPLSLVASLLGLIVTGSKSKSTMEKSCLWINGLWLGLNVAMLCFFRMPRQH
jgi:hypothetical protein